MPEKRVCSRNGMSIRRKGASPRKEVHALDLPIAHALAVLDALSKVELRVATSAALVASLTP